jgi:hypothetical protein
MIVEEDRASGEDEDAVAVVAKPAQWEELMAQQKRRSCHRPDRNPTNGYSASHLLLMYTQSYRVSIPFVGV